MKKVEEAHAQDVGRLLENQRKLYEDANTLMNNLALFSGAFATGSLILLASEKILVSRSLIITGIITFSAIVILCFFYLFHYHGKATQEARKSFEKLSSCAELLVQYAKYRKGEITFEEIDKIVLEKAIQAEKNEEKRLKLFLQKEHGRNYWDIIFAVLLGMGFVFIALGLVFPNF